MALMGYREYARHRGCSLYAVQKAIADKRIVATADDKGRPRIDAVAADAAWERNTDLAKRSVLHGANAPAAPRASHGGGVGDDGADDAAPDDATEDYRKARAESMQLRVERERMELEVDRGNLVPLDHAKRLVFTAFRGLRDNVLNVPTRIKHQLAAEGDAELCERLLEAELTAVLGAFTVDAALREQADDDEEEGGA